MVIQESWVDCAVCGSDFFCRSHLGGRAYGYTSLDGREFNGTSTLFEYALDMCPYCHYVNTYLGCLNVENAKKIVRSKEYRKIISEAPSQTLKKIYAYLYLTESSLTAEDLGYYHQVASWCFDDQGNIEKGNEERGKAIEYHQKVLSEDNTQNALSLIVLDLYRRSGRFDEAMEYAKTIVLEEGKNKEYNQLVIDYQMELCKQKDDSVHTTEKPLSDLRSRHSD